ncbi:hypothetical protein MASR1M32_24770 [Rhodobacter sp.]
MAQISPPEAKAGRGRSVCDQRGGRPQCLGGEAQRLAAGFGVEDVGQHDQLIGAGLGGDAGKPVADLCGIADHGAREHARDLDPFLHRPVVFDIGDRRRREAAVIAQDAAEALLRGGEKPLRFGLGRGADGMDPDGGIGLREVFRRLEAAAVEVQRLVQIVRGEMAGEGIGQAQFGRQHGAEIRRSQHPELDLGPRGGPGADIARLVIRGEPVHQLLHVLGEVVGAVGRGADRAQGRLIGAGRAAKAEVDPPGEQARQRAELFGDDIGRVVRQHDAARADADMARLLPGMGQHHCRCGRGDALHVVMLGHPVTGEAQGIDQSRGVLRLGQRVRGIAALADADKIKQRQADGISHGRPSRR